MQPRLRTCGIETRRRTNSGNCINDSGTIQRLCLLSLQTTENTGSWSVLCFWVSSLKRMPHLTHRKQMGVDVRRDQSSCFHDSEDTRGLNALRGRLPGPLSLGCYWQLDEPFPCQFLLQNLAEQNTIKASELLNVLFVGPDQGRATSERLPGIAGLGDIRHSIYHHQKLLLLLGSPATSHFHAAIVFSRSGLRIR